jgi:hypothetical protein
VHLRAGSHGSLRFAQTSTSRRIGLGASSSDPRKISTLSPVRKNNREPQIGQNCRRSSVRTSPVTWNWSRRQFAVTEALEPVGLRQVVQWQRPDTYGSPLTS